MSLSEAIVLILASIGVFFTLVSAIGILRLPDVYARMYAAGKASTLGVSCILIAAGVHFGQWEARRMAILVALFLITGPISATTMGRATYRTDLRRRLILHYDELEAAHSSQSPSDSPSNTGAGPMH
jgi:multicomponent Na+:H+ antiporter subunit G